MVREVGPHHWSGTIGTRSGPSRSLSEKRTRRARSIMEEVAALQKRGRPDTVAAGDWEKRLEDLFGGPRRRATGPSWRPWWRRPRCISVRRR